jgi:hypothetical protein
LPQIAVELSRSLGVGEAGQPLVDHRQHAVVDEVGDECLQCREHTVGIQGER